MKLDSNTILLIVATLVIAAGAYWFFFTGTGNEPPLTVTTTQNDAQAQFKILVSELQPISFATDIFTDPRFAALIDLTTSVAPEPAGRLDPFAPIAGVAGQ